MRLIAFDRNDCKGELRTMRICKEGPRLLFAARAFRRRIFDRGLPEPRRVQGMQTG